MARTKNRNNNTQEDTMTETPTTQAPEAAEIDPTEFDDVDVDLGVDVDDETEDIPDAPAGSSTPTKAKKEEKPKRGDLPDGWVTPIQLAKELGKRGLHTDRDGNVVDEVKPQMVYSYMKNSPKDDRLEPQDIEDSNGVMRSALRLDEALAWWERKNARAAERKQNAAAKEAKKNAPKQSDQALVETGEAGPGILQNTEEAE